MHPPTSRRPRSRGKDRIRGRDCFPADKQSHQRSRDGPLRPIRKSCHGTPGTAVQDSWMVLRSDQNPSLMGWRWGRGSRLKKRMLHRTRIQHGGSVQDFLWFLSLQFGLVRQAGRGNEWRHVRWCTQPFLKPWNTCSWMQKEVSLRDEMDCRSSTFFVLS